MTENSTETTSNLPNDAASTTPAITPSDEASVKTQNRKDTIRAVVIIGVILLVLAAIITSIVLLVNADSAKPGTAALVRDIFIIFMGLVSLLVMIALTILIIQLSILINMLQNEIKPILHTTNETVNNLRGTTTFISNNLVEPIMKMNEYLAGLRRFFDLIRPGRP